MRKFLITLLFLFGVSAPVFAQSPQITTQMTTTTTAIGTGVAVPTTGYHMITWTLAGPAPTACTVAVDSSADNSSWTAGGAIPGQTCTSGGQSAVVNLSTGYIRINVTAFTGTGTLKVFYLGTSGISGSSTTSTVSIGAPVGTCAQGALDTDKNTGNLYACNNGTWVLAGGGAGIVYSAGGGTAQAQTMTPSPAATSLNTGTTLYCWLPTAANSGAAPTLAISGLTAKPITKYGTVALIANDITTVGIACVIYDGTEFQLQVPNAGVVARTSVQAVGAAAQVMNLYVSNGCDGISACTGFFWGIQAPASMVASLQYTGNTTDGSGNAAFVTDGLQHMYAVQLPQYIAGAGAADVMTATYVPAFSAYAAGEEFDVLPNLANTLTNPTLNVNALGAKTVTKCGTAVLLAGDYSTTAVAKFIYDGTRMQLQNPVSGCAAIPIGNIGSAGLSGTSPVTISAAGAIGCATCVATGQTNVYGAFLQDFTAGTMEIPEAAGFTTNVNSTIGLDTTANRTHHFTNATDSTSTDTVAQVAVTIGSGADIAATQLCSTTACPVGNYRVNVYIDMTTPCGTTGTFIAWLGYTDDSGARTGTSTTTFFDIQGVGAVPSTGTLTTTSTANWGQATYILRTTGAATGGLGSINYGATRTACGTAGPMVGKMYLTVEAL